MRKLFTTILIIIYYSFSNYLWSENINYVVIDNQAQPFQIEENGTKHSGIVTDIVKEVFKNSDYQLSTRTLPFKRMITMMETQKYKNWVTFGSPAWPGIQNENLSNIPIYNVKNIMLIKKSAFKYKTEADLMGKTVILMDGFDYPGLDKLIAQGKIKEIRTKNHSSAFKIIERPSMSKFTGFIELKARVLYNLRKSKRNEFDYQMIDVSHIANNYSIHLAFSKQIDKNIQQFIDNRLQVIKQSGKLDNIIKQYQ